MRKVGVIVLAVLWAFPRLSIAQIDTVNQQISSGKDPKGTASPSVEGARKSKALSLKYNVITSYLINSKSNIEGIEDTQAEVRRLNEFQLKVNAPLVLKPHIKIILGVKYQLEEYNFISTVDSDINTNLQDKNLHALGANVNIIKSLNDKNWLLIRVGAALNGDYSTGEFPLARYLKYQASGIYGWKSNPRTAVGLGASFNYTLGRPSIYPVILWNKTFNSKWGLEALFPARVLIRHNVSEKTLLLAGYEIQGDSYHITVDDPPLSGFPALELRRSDILTKITFEQEIYDFLWFSLEGGYRYNLNFDVAQDNSFNNRAVLENKVTSSMFFNISLFVVPPRKFTTKYLKEGLQ